MSKKILLAVGLIITAALVLQARSFSVANNIPTTEYFKIKPKGSHLCLGIENYKQNSRLVMTSCRGDNAKWKFYKYGNGVYALRSKRGRYLGIKNIKKNKSEVIYTSHYQKVKLLAQTDDTFFIKLAVGGKVLDVAGKVRKRGTRVIQYKYHGRSNQQWQLRFADTGRTFNRVTYRPAAPERDRSSANSSGSRADLKTSLQRGDYAVLRYFKTCSYQQLSNDTRDGYLTTYLNAEKMSKRLIKVQKIVNGAKGSSSSSVRSKTYRTLLGVTLSGGNFLEKMVKGKIRKDVQKAMRSETRSSNKQYLQQLADKLR